MAEYDPEKKEFWQKWSFQKEEYEIAKNLGITQATLEKVKADLERPTERRYGKRTKRT